MPETNVILNRKRNRQQLFVLCGIVAPVLFTIIVAVASLLRPGYSQTYNFISDLGVGPYAIIQNVNFWIFGLLVICFSLGLWGGLPTPKGPASKVGVALVILFGCGVFLAGVFPEDYGTGKMHSLVSSLAFLAIIAAQLLIWWGLRKGDHEAWGKYRTYSLISGILSFAMLVVLGMAMGGDYQGAAQRAFLAVPWIWIGVTGLQLYAQITRAGSQS